MKKELNIIIVGAALWCGGIVLAPITAGTIAGDLLYRLYHIVCHQFDSRSFHLEGAPFGVCIRCTAIYGGFLLTLLILRFSDRLRSLRIRPMLLIAVTALPMAWDGVLSLFGLVDATTISRSITGMLFGTGLALMLHEVLCESVHSLITNLSRTYGTTTR